MFLFFRLVLLSISLLAMSVAHAQNDDQAPPDTEGYSRVSKTVPIVQSPSDKAIVIRLERILGVTGWYRDLKIQSTEGVVNLRGLTAKKSQSEWAEKLAHDTDGVIAVTNEIEVEPTGLWNLKPAKTETEELVKKATAFLPYLLTSIVVLAIFILLASLTNKLGRRAAQRRVKNPLLIELIAKLSALPVLLLGLYLVLRMSGLSGIAFTILGGTGAMGLIIGFALKNILENYFSGILLSLRNPYTVGDKVEIGGKVGVVQQLTTRGTILVDFDGNHIIIPNNTIYGGMIINMSANPSSRLKFTLNVGYNSNINQVRGAVIDVLKSSAEVLTSPEPLVIVEEFTASGILITVLFWIDSAKSSGGKVKSFVMECVKVRLQKDGVEFPGVETRILGKPKLADAEAFNEEVEDLPVEGTDTKNEASELLQQANRGRSIDHGDRLM